MGTSRINRVAGIFLALILTAGVAVSSNNLDGKNRKNSPQETCVNSISGLSEYQREKIIEIETQNQTIVNELREKQRSASGKTQKEPIKKQMEKQVKTHQNAVTSVLSADQQQQFLQFQDRGAKQNTPTQKQGMGKGKGHGDGSGKGRGNGNKYQM